MFLRWIRLALGLSHFQGLYDLIASLVWIDDLVNISQFSSFIRACKGLAVVSNSLFLLLIGKLVPEDDVYCTISPHNCDLSCWICEVYISSDMLA